MCHLIQRRVRVAIVEVGKQKFYIFQLCICRLSYTACKAHAPFHIVYTLSHKWHDFRWKYILNIKIVFQFTPRHLSGTLLIRRRIQSYIIIKVKWSRYRHRVAQRVGRGIAVLFHARGTRRGWVVSSTPRPHITPGKDPVPILREARWAPVPVWTGG